MNATLGTVLIGIGLSTCASMSCAHKDDQSARVKEPSGMHDSPTAAEQRRRIDERRAEQRRIDERAAEQRRIDERVAEQRGIDERRAEERGAEEQRRIDERRFDATKANRSVGGGPADPNSAVSKIAGARCEREVRCNNVGTKAKYSSRADCVTRMQNDKRDDINDKDCPGGIDKKQLGECLTAVRDEACGNPVDTIGRFAACRSSALCVK